MKRRAQPCEARPPLCHAGRDAPRAIEKPQDGDNFSAQARSKTLGTVFEARALEYLQRRRLRLVARNVSCRGGEIDLVMRDYDDALVFVEVRARAGRGYGGAVASVSREKRRRLVHAAQYYLATRGDTTSACRFDVVAFDGCRVVWLRDAFREDGP